MTSNDVGLSQVLAAQAGKRLPLSSALYVCGEVARLISHEHEMSRTISGLGLDHLRCTRAGGVVLAGSRVHHPDVRNDVKAVGVLLYQLLTGKVPPARDIPAPSHFNPGVDADLDAVILAALAQDPAQRPASVRVIEAALGSVFEELDLTPSPDELAELIKAAPPPAQAPRPAPAKATPIPMRAVPAPKPQPAAPAARRPPPKAFYADEDDEDTASLLTNVPSWQDQERDRKVMVVITVCLLAAALIFALWPSSKSSRASLGDDTPPARVSTRR